MHQYNLIIFGFIAAAFLLALWWTFNTIRRIDNQKNYCAVQLTSIAKLWHRAKYVPEDAKERESLYLYRDFLRKFDEDEGQYPVMVKDGKVRCMTRKEYDNLVGQKNIAPISILLSIVSLILAGGAIAVNLLITKTPWVGLGLAAIMPILQIVLAFFVARFNRDKNNYRDGIFLALKENSAAFLRITKPFIVVDAYPDKFGKNKKPLYATVGELTEEQIAETRDFIIRQKEAETKVVMNSVDNTREIHRLTEKTTEQPELKSVSEVVEEPTPVETVPAQPVAAEPAAPAEEELLQYDKERLLEAWVDDYIQGEVDRAVKQAKKNPTEAAPAPIEKIEPLEPLPVEPTEVAAPAEDDFSLEAIGQALDAEIAKRSKRNKK